MQGPFLLNVSQLCGAEDWLVLIWLQKATAAQDWQFPWEMDRTTVILQKMPFFSKIGYISKDSHPFLRTQKIYIIVNQIILIRLAMGHYWSINIQEEGTALWE